MTRGFAQTVHCPRCGTAKPTGVEVVPIVTCAQCGLGFDPKPREREPRAQALVPVVQGLVHEEIADTDAELWLRESLFGGVWRTLVAILLGVVASIAAQAGNLDSAALCVVVGVLALYGGIGRIVNRTIVYVSRDLIAVRQRPLPRHRERLITGDVWSLAIERAPNTAGHHIVATEAGGDRRSLRLADVEHAEPAQELVRAIETQRARLGAPVLSPSDD